MMLLIYLVMTLFAADIVIETVLNDTHLIESGKLEIKECLIKIINLKCDPIIPQAECKQLLDCIYGKS